MASYTITTSAVHDAAIKIIVTRINAQQVGDKSKTPTKLLTVDDYVQARFQEVLRSWAMDMQGQILAAAEAMWPGLNDGQRKTILGLLSLPGFTALSVPDQVTALRQLAPAAFASLSMTDQDSIIRTLGV